ncbi:MAG: NlpC/P60 family protein [Actinobacteria bacterium]|nr:MAG: NlpC/P60 family protein [Actinomycetota bacterium]
MAPADKSKMQLLATRFGTLRLAVAAIGLVLIGAASAALVAGAGGGARHGKNVVSLDANGTQVAANGTGALAGIGDSEARQSYAQTRANAPKHAKARAPRSNTASMATGISPGAPSDAEVKRELKQLERGGPGAPGGRAILLPNGQAEAPVNAPGVVARVIAGGNAIANFPYIWGGGHGSWQDNGYDCSGSVSYALAAGGLLKSPLTSGSFESWGDPGPGKWITIEASGGHVYMYVAGLRFDTSGRSGPLGTRWSTLIRSNAGFVARHPPGL